MKPWQQHRRDINTWLAYDRDELARLMVLEVVAAEMREQDLRSLHEFSRNEARAWAARVWADNRRGARVIAALREADKKGRKTVRVADLLAIADDTEHEAAA